VRCIVQLAVAALSFWAIGAALMLGSGSAVIGFNARLLFIAGADSSIFVSAIFFCLMLTLIAASPIAAAMGERSKTLPIWLAAGVLAAIVVPICGYWTWTSTGWLFRIGFIDAGGASVLHLTGGLVAGVAAICIGPRANKYNTDGSSNFIPGHSTPLAAAGLLLVAVGWFPYLIGAALLHGQSAPRAAINLALALAASTVVTYGMSRARYGKPDVLLTLSGMLAGLVSISAAPGAVNPIAAVAIGGIGGMLVLWGSVHLDMNWKIDDPSGAVAPLVIGGAWATLAAGIFTPHTGVGQRLQHIAIQSAGLIAIALVAGGCAFALFYVLKRISILRISEAEEYDGIDLAEHDLNAYPDFQQTMIKSYHLREA